MLFQYPRTKLPLKQVLLLNLLLFLLYTFCGWVGLFFSSFSPSCSTFWPPSGIALAAVLIFGFQQVFVGVILGSIGVSLFWGPSIIPLAGLIFAALAESLIAATMLHSVEKQGRFKFKTPKDIFSFIGIAVFLAPFVASTIAILSYYVSGNVSLELVPKTWITFLVGNSLGILLVTPFVLSLFEEKHRKINVPEALTLITLIFVIGWIAFSGHGFQKFLIIPLLTWAPLRFSFRGVSVCNFILGVIAVYRSTFFGGVFDLDFPETDLLWIQCLTAAATIIGYFLATVVEVREEAQLELDLNLKHKKIAEEALAILDQSINKSPIGFALIDRNYKYIRVNETLANYNGHSIDYHLGRTVREIIPGRAEFTELMINKVFETGDSFMNNFFHGMDLKRGTPSSGFASYYPIKHPATNEIFSVGVTIQEMTEQFKFQNLLQEKQDFLTFAQEAGKIGSFEWDLATGKVKWTSELEHIYGLEEGEFGEDFNSWLELIHPEDYRSTRTCISDVIQGAGEVNLQFRIITKNKDIKWILARGKKVRNSETGAERFIGINIDLTEQKNIEHKLRLTEANLLHALSVRDEFVATASHELKTPLTSLKLQTQMLQRGLEKKDSSYTHEKIVNHISKNSCHVDRLTRLVDDMLDISRIRTGKLTLKKESCELSVILKDILSRLHDQFETCGSGQPIIETLDEAHGEWDPLRIEQVLTNITTNAIRYGQGKAISISIEKREETVLFMVRDRGLGIAKSDHEKIFKRYERGLLQREIAGLGIGLFITQQIVLAHKGKIWLESAIGQGTTFFVELPRSPLPDFIPTTPEVNLLSVL